MRSGKDSLGEQMSREELVEELRRLRRELAECCSCQGDDLFTSAFRSAAIGMALVAPNGTWLKVNKALCAIVGYSPRELVARTFQDITHPDDLDQDLDCHRRMLEGEIDSYQIEKRYIHKSGRVINILLNASLVHNLDGTPKFLISQIQDITSKKRLEEELLRIAGEDFLTKVHNRRRFMEHAEREIMRGERFAEPLALLMLDIDNFKAINDAHGHDVGDEVLRAVAACGRNTLRSIDLFGRIGGEEFAALLLNTDAEIALIVAERMRENIARLEVPAPGGPVRLTVSIGLTAFTGGGKSLESRLKMADMALYAAKRDGRNRVEAALEPQARITSAERMRTTFFRLVWKPEYESGHELIDAQHNELFRLANELLSSIIAGLAAEGIGAVVTKLAEHAVRHFQDEEAAFRAAGYPAADEHAEIHRALTAALTALAEKLAEGRLDLGELFRFLAVDVVMRHMLDEDRKFFPYLGRNAQ